jgi:hypothetical protein
MADLFALLAATVLGVALAASCGLRTFLPLFIVGLVGRLTGWVDIGDEFNWVTSTPALVAFGTGAFVEMAGDKFPWLDNFLNAIQTPVRTLAGALIYASVAVDMPLWVLAILALILGGGVALAVHTAKSGLRLGSTAATGGAANPVLSLLEDVGCAISTVLSLVAFAFALLVAAGALAVLVISGREVYRRLAKGSA